MFKYMLISLFLFFVGVLGLFFTKKHMILLLLCLELIFLAMNYNFVIYSIFLDDLLGQFYAVCMVTVAAAESAIGLSILMMFYRISGGISLDIMNLLKN